MKLNSFLIVLVFLVISNCKSKPYALSAIKGNQIAITNSLASDAKIESYIKPYSTHVNAELDSVLAYSVNTYSKTNGTLNTAIGNLLADAVYSQTDPIFKSRTGKNIDMVLLNFGGIRSELPKGNITLKTIYNIMPFENSIYVVALKKPQMDSLVKYLCRSQTAHPISKLNIEIDKQNKLVLANINNKPIENRIYYVATSDYLYNGGDHMDFFKTRDTLYNINYKIRNALIDYFKTVDTINPVIDNRFIKIDNPKKLK